MPKLNDFQNSTVRLLDYLYFHDVVAMQGFSEEKSSIYSQLLAAIDLLAYRRSEGALIREHYKHLLCTRQISQNPYPIRVLPS